MAAVGVPPDELDEFLRVLYRQRSKQHDIHHAEHGGVGANAQRQR